MDGGQIGVIRTDRRKRQKNGSFKEIEDLREAGANVATRANWGQASIAADPLIASCVLEEWGHEAGYRL